MQVLSLKKKFLLFLQGDTKCFDLISNIKVANKLIVELKVDLIKT